MKSGIKEITIRSTLMNSKPLLLSVAILTTLTACGGSSNEQTVLEQPQTLAPQPGSSSTPPPPTTSPTPPPTIAPPPPSPPPFMKPVPDYAGNMTNAEKVKAKEAKMVRLGLNPALVSMVKYDKLDTANIKFLTLELKDQTEILALDPDYTISPYASANTLPARWISGKHREEYELQTPKVYNDFHNKIPVKKLEFEADIKSYEQYYSVLQRSKDISKRAWADDGTVLIDKKEPFELGKRGWYTTSLPSSGSVLYRGIAMDRTENTGKLSYMVNFGTKTGEGTITDLLPGKIITLINASNVGGRLKGEVRVDGKDAYPHPETNADIRGVEHEVYFYGPNAEEILGDIEKGTETFAGFAGQQQ